jgi:hypothetical protein
MTAALLTHQVRGLAARRRLAVSSVALVYASALSYTHFCVIPNADAYRLSRLEAVICSKGDR